MQIMGLLRESKCTKIMLVRTMFPLSPSLCTESPSPGHLLMRAQEVLKELHACYKVRPQSEDTAQGSPLYGRHSPAVKSRSQPPSSSRESLRLLLSVTFHSRKHHTAPHFTDNITLIRHDEQEKART